MKLSVYIAMLQSIQLEEGDMDVVKKTSLRIAALANAPRAEIRYKDGDLYFDNNDDGCNIQGEKICLI